MKGKGAGLPVPSFSYLPTPVTAQLVNSETNTCFAATYGALDVKKNDGGQFKAKTQEKTPRRSSIVARERPVHSRPDVRVLTPRLSRRGRDST